MNRPYSNHIFSYNFSYITLGMYSEAAYLLFRRTNVELLEFAAHLAKLAGNDDLQKAIEDKVEALRKPVDLTGEFHLSLLK